MIELEYKSDISAYRGTPKGYFVSDITFYCKISPHGLVTVEGVNVDGKDWAKDGIQYAVDLIGFDRIQEAAIEKYNCIKNDPFGNDDAAYENERDLSVGA